jgi:hypothetical protein
MLIAGEREGGWEVTGVVSLFVFAFALNWDWVGRKLGGFGYVCVMRMRKEEGVLTVMMDVVIMSSLVLVLRQMWMRMWKERREKIPVDGV